MAFLELVADRKSSYCCQLKWINTVDVGCGNDRAAVWPYLKHFARNKVILVIFWPFAFAD